MSEVTPKTKVCTECGRKRSLRFYRKQTHGLYGLTSKCNDCVSAYQKIYRARPEVKKRHREREAKWRRENHDKFIEMSRKTYRKFADKQNAERREKRKSDPVFAQKIRDREIRYKASGRRQEMHRRRQQAKTLELRMKSAEWKKKNPEKVRAFVKRYRANVQIHKERKWREELHDSYVIAIIKQQLGNKIKTKDIPKELIEIERIRIFIHRKLKQL
jgi:hypothetical protein